MASPTLFYTGIQVKDMQEALHFFCDICGMEKVGPSSDELPADMLRTLQTQTLPHLFGLEEKEVRFQSQLIAPVGNHAAVYELFEWITPKWTQTVSYVPSCHTGIFRSNVLVEGFDDLMRRCDEYEGCSFISDDEVAWAGMTGDPENPVSFSRMRLVRHEGSGAVLQMKGPRRKKYLDDTPGRITAIRHRAEHVTDYWRAEEFFERSLGCGRNTFADSEARPFLSGLNDNVPFRNYLTGYALQRLFGYSLKDYPYADGLATYLEVLGLDGKPQNLDIFEWIAPRAVGKPYPTTTHIGFQRLCFIVNDYDEVYERVRNNPDVRIVGQSLEIPAFAVPETGMTVSRAFSVFDPTGVFHLILG